MNKDTFSSLSIKHSIFSSLSQKKSGEYWLRQRLYR